MRGNYLSRNLCSSGSIRWSKSTARKAVLCGGGKEQSQKMFESLRDPEKKKEFVEICSFTLRFSLPLILTIMHHSFHCKEFISLLSSKLGK